MQAYASCPMNWYDREDNLLHFVIFNILIWLTWNDQEDHKLYSMTFFL